MTVLAREVAGLVKDVAAAALWLVVAAVLIVAALKGPDPYTALTILCVLAGGRGISILRALSAMAKLDAAPLKPRGGGTP